MPNCSIIPFFKSFQGDFCLGEWMWDHSSTPTKPVPQSLPGLWLVLLGQCHHLLYMTPGVPLTSPSQAGVMEVSRSMLVPLAPFSFAAQSRGAMLDAPARVAGIASTSCSIAEAGKNRKQVVTNSPHSLLLRQQNHTQPLTQGKLLRHRLVLGKIHCIWHCSFPFSFYLVFLCFLLAPNAIWDSTGTAAHCVFAVQRPVGASGYSTVVQLACVLVHPACTFPCSCSCSRCSAKNEVLGHWGSSVKSIKRILCFCWKGLRETNSKDQKAMCKMWILLFFLVCLTLWLSFICTDITIHLNIFSISQVCELRFL